jgi:hypothetical protein
MKPHLPAVIGTALLGPAVLPIVGALYLCDKVNRAQAERAMKKANPDHPDYQKKNMNGKVY